MKVLVTKGFINKPIDFEIKKIKRSYDCLGLHILSVLEIEEKDDLQLFYDVISRMMAIYRNCTIHHKGTVTSFEESKDVNIDGLFNHLKNVK